MCIIIGYTKLSVNISILLITIIVYSLIEYTFAGISNAYIKVIENNSTNSLHLEANITKEKNVSTSEKVNIIQEKSKASIMHKEEKTNANGIWQIEISNIKLKAPIAEGTTEKVMNKDVGHFENTSKWNGNIGLAAHNRRLPSKLF